MSAFPRQRAALYPKSESTYLTEDLKIFFPPKTHPLHNLKIYVRLYTYQLMVNVALLMDSSYMPLL